MFTKTLDTPLERPAALPIPVRPAPLAWGVADAVDQLQHAFDWGVYDELTGATADRFVLADLCFRRRYEAGRASVRN